MGEMRGRKELGLEDGEDEGDKRMMWKLLDVQKRWNRRAMDD
jgi:hypothetical protein